MLCPKGGQGSKRTNACETPGWGFPMITPRPVGVMTSTRSWVQCLALFVVEHDRHATLRIMVDTDAIQALEAGVVPDGAIGLDRVISALGLATLAWLAAFRAPGQPVPAPQAPP